MGPLFWIPFVAACGPWVVGVAAARLSSTFLYVPLYVPIRSGRPLHFPASGGTDKAHTLRKYSLRGSNPRPVAHKTIALTTELREPLPARSKCKWSLRSYTFRATLSCFLQMHIRFYTFPIHSVYVPLCFCSKLVQELYVPIRSEQPSRDLCKLLYVPIRSLYIPYTFLLVFGKNMSQSYTFLYVPRDPSRNSCECCPKVIRSYTFLKHSYTFLQVILKMLSNSYTFLYVPITFLHARAGNL